MGEGPKMGGPQAEAHQRITRHKWPRRLYGLPLENGQCPVGVEAPQGLSAGTEYARYGSLAGGGARASTPMGHGPWPPRCRRPLQHASGPPKGGNKAKSRTADL